MATENKDLTHLRQKIDKIDNSIQDLLNDRAEIVEEVRKVKDDHGSKIKIRPAREAEILYRLMKRQKGRFPKQEMTRIWREIICATIKFEGEFKLAVYYSDAETGFGDLARDQYGSYTPATRFSSSRRIVEAVKNGEATLGILPVPFHDESENWWRLIVSSQPDTPKIAGRLPFIDAGITRNKGLQAIVICSVEHEPTEQAQSFIAIESSEDIGFATINKCILDADLSPGFQQSCYDPERPPGWTYLVQLNQFLDQKGPKNDQLVNNLNRYSLRLNHIGGYAMPLTEINLNTASTSTEDN